ncbi:hypothetical protein OH76DRAFT_362443 [Lentinus brumalis]|uniref:Uncharacterized protein n=1 Tax=Lentinus brumalis TaxID=2498619 RepID=A0A371DE58_9APHY|nr:hypothetical protein OH76DRAFT_362443 [Polyporus brumalis]
MTTDQATPKKKAARKKRPRSSAGKTNEAPKSEVPAAGAPKKKSKPQKTNGAKDKLPGSFAEFENKEERFPLWGARLGGIPPPPLGPARKKTRRKTTPISTHSSSSVSARRGLPSPTSSVYHSHHLGSTPAPAPTTSCGVPSNHELGGQHAEQGHSNLFPTQRPPEWLPYTAGHRPSSTPTPYYGRSPETLRHTAIPCAYPPISQDDTSVHSPSSGTIYHESSDEYLMSSYTPSPDELAMLLPSPSLMGTMMTSGPFVRSDASAHVPTEQCFDWARGTMGPPPAYLQHSCGEVPQVGSPAASSIIDSEGPFTPTDSFGTFPPPDCGRASGVELGGALGLLVAPTETCYRKDSYLPALSSTYPTSLQQHFAASGFASQEDPVGPPFSPQVAPPTPEYWDSGFFVPHSASIQDYNVHDLALLPGTATHGVAIDGSRLENWHEPRSCLTTPSDDFHSRFITDEHPQGGDFLHDVALNISAPDCMGADELHRSGPHFAVGDTTSQMLEQSSTFVWGSDEGPARTTWHPDHSTASLSSPGPGAFINARNQSGPGLGPHFDANIDLSAIIFEQYPLLQMDLSKDTVPQGHCYHDSDNWESDPAATDCQLMDHGLLTHTSVAPSAWCTLRQRLALS